MNESSGITNLMCTVANHKAQFLLPVCIILHAMWNHTFVFSLFYSSYADDVQSYILSQPDILIEFTKQTDCIAGNKNWITKNFPSSTA